MQINVIDGIQGLDRLRPAWERAFAADSVAPIFLNWWWQRGWQEVSPYPYSVLTLTPAGSPEPVAFLPLSVRGSASLLRLDHVREIHMGGDPGSDYNGLVCLPAHEEAVVSALVDYFSRRLPWDRLIWKEINDHRVSKVMQSLPSSSAEVFPRQGTCCPYTPLPATWEDFQQQCLSYETRKSLRKKMRLCEDECRVTFMDESNIDQHVDALVSLARNRTRKKMDDNVGRSDRIFKWAAKGGIASVLLIWHGETPIAGMGHSWTARPTRIAFISPGTTRNSGNIRPAAW